MRVSFMHVERQVAVEVVEATIAEYISETAQSANIEATEAISFYQERLRAYETTILPRSSQALTDYLASHPQVQSELQQNGGTSDPDYAFLEQQARADREQYHRYQQRLDDVQTQSLAVDKNQSIAFRIVDPPTSPPESGKLSKKKVLMFAGVGAGLSLGYVAIFLGLATELDRTMRTPGDVRRRLQLPVLEVVGDYSAASTSAQDTRGKRRKRQLWGWSS